jgi:branched-chain amino acid transport system permease protein
MGNLYGPVAGAILLTWLTDILSKYQEYSLPVYGIILILLLIFFPDGIGARLNVRVIYLIGYWAKRRREIEENSDATALDRKDHQRIVQKD